MCDLISIVIPVFNVEKYIEECLDSVITQTYKNLEIIIVNDGSTDNSSNLCKKYMYDDRIIFINKDNEGLSSARAEGIAKIKGKYFCTIDSDDYLDKYYIEKMYKKIKEHESDICVCGRIAFYPNGEKQAFYLDEVLPQVYKITKNNLEDSYAEIARKYQMSDSWNKMYKADFVKNTGITFFLDKTYNGTDLLYNHLLLLHCPKITCINEVLYNYRIVQTSRVRRKNKKLYIGFIHITEILYNHAEMLKYNSEMFEQISILYTFFMKYATFDIYNEIKNKKKRRLEYQEMMIYNKNFISNNRKILLNQKMPTKSMQVFEFVLYKNSTELLGIYNMILEIIKTLCLK